MKHQIIKYSLISGIIAIFAFIFYIFFYPMNKEKRIIELENGDRLSIVADKLQKNDIINSKFGLKYGCILLGIKII